MNTLFSEMFKINWRDLTMGLLVAIGAALLGILKDMVVGHGFDFSAYDWHLILNAAWIAAGSYLSKNFFSDSQGRVFGRIG